MTDSKPTNNFNAFVVMLLLAMQGVSNWIQRSDIDKNAQELRAIRAAVEQYTKGER